MPFFQYDLHAFDKRSRNKHANSLKTLFRILKRDDALAHRSHTKDPSSKPHVSPFDAQNARKAPARKIDVLRNIFLIPVHERIHHTYEP